MTADFSDAHDRQMWECFSQLVGIASSSAKAQQYITIPLSLGRNSVELCQKGQRVRALVELGRFLSNDLEPPPHCRDDDPGLNVRAKDKERTCPELTGQHGRCHLVVLAGDVGGRWSAETDQFLAALADAKVLPGEGSMSLDDVVESDHRMHGDEGMCRLPSGEAPIPGVD